MRHKMGVASLSLGVLAFAYSSHLAYGQGIDSGRYSRPLITQNIDESKRIPLSGNTRPEAKAGNDRGAVAQDFPVEHMLLQLKRPPEREQALQQFINELQTEGSPNFHKWITAQEFGERFGLAKQDLDAITGWLESHGFKVNVVYPSGMVIDFSGTAGQVREAFQTEIHHLEVKGEKHIANMSDPRIPAALGAAVSGIVSIHDFRPHVMYKLHKWRDQYTFTDTLGGNNYAVVPADLATIYNLNPLFNVGYSGQGQTIAVIEDTDVFSSSDWNTFRTTLGLSGYTSGSFATVQPAPSNGSNNCMAPGIIAPNDAEAILDAEWASAAAPSAAIVMATCADSGTTFGGLIAFQNLINASSQPPAIISISYGECETVNGAAANAAYSSAYQQAVTEGLSVFTAAGDSGAAGCDNSAAEATDGIGVNAFASTPYNVAVGGTDFSDTYSGTNASYWNSSNTPTFGSAKSYIPETPWNNSCAGGLLSTYFGYSPTYGSSSLCNAPLLGSLLLSTVAGGGGPSGCATGTPSPSNSEIVNGTCQGWPKPSWQSVLGNPNDAVRDTPDVSLFAADGLWGHFYVFCWSDTANGGAACTGAPSSWSGAGGTSFASPIMAGIQALVNQKAGGPQGNPDPVYYQLASKEYGSSGSSSCNSSTVNGVNTSCIFYDVTLGDMDIDCVGIANCYLADGAVGVLSTSDSSFNPTYGATTGWDFATGIGSVNAANLVNNWPVSGPNFSLSGSPSSVTIVRGTTGSITITVTPQNGFSGDVSLSASGLPSGVTTSFSPSSTSTTSTLTLTASSTADVGTATVIITGMSGSLMNVTTVTLTLNDEGNFAVSASPSSLTLTQGASVTSTITVTQRNRFNSSVSLAASGLPNGVTASFSPNPTPSASTLTLTASSTAATGTVSVTITGTSGSLSNTTAVTLTVTQAPDLIISALSAPSTGGTGMILTVTDTTKNQGAGAADPTTTRFYLSTNTTLDASDVALGSRAVPALAPGATSSGSTVVTIPAGTATGVYYILAKADSDNVVAETNEANNLYPWYIQVGPDLVMSAVSAPATGGAGMTLTVTDTTKNQGAGAADPTTTRFYLSTNTALDASDVALGSRAVPALAPGATSSGSTVVTIPAGMATGAYYILAKADADNLVAETQEGNNVYWAYVQVGPDLVMSAVSTPATGGAGMTLTVTDTTKNQGAGAADPTTTRFYLSTNTTLDASDVALGSRAVPALAPGATSSGSTVVTIPAGTATGAYYILAKADSDNVVAETQEGNNVYWVYVQVGPDLVMSAVSAPATGGAGMTLTVTDTTKNQGAGAADPTTTRFYLSTNTTLDASDVALGSRAVPALAPGATSSGSTVVTIPAGTATGAYYILAKADADNVVAETQEGNNVYWAYVQLGPDLVMSAVSAPATGGAGMTLTVTDTTKNQGAGAADPTTTRFYLSTNTTLDASDVALGSRPVPALAPGATSSGSTVVTITAGTATGAYYILAKADADNVVVETQEGNNVYWAYVQVGPDLVMSAVSAPATGGAGMTLTVTDTTKNQGAGAADPTTTRFYLSTNTTLDASDVALGSRAVPALAPGATSSGSTVVTIPAGTATGAYYILAKADADNVVVETQEGNNVYWAYVQVGPDLVMSAVSAPATGGAGMTLTVTDTTKNQGAGAADPTTTRFYLSTNTTLDASDVALGSRAVPALAPGATSSGSTVVTIPAGTATGAYYILAKADSDNVVAETQEGNNVYWAYVQVETN